VSDPMSGLMRNYLDLERRIGQTEVREIPGAVVARYTTAAGQSIANAPVTPVIVNFGTLVRDPYSRVTVGAAWKFTANVAGDYGVSASILFAATAAWADTEAGYIALYLNNALYSNLHRKDSYTAATAVFMMLSGMDTIYLNVGDFIDIRAFQNSGGALALFNDATFNYVNVWKL
jgi:uncharacterized membrane protein